MVDESKVFKQVGHLLGELTHKSEYYWRNTQNLRGKKIRKETKAVYDYLINNIAEPISKEQIGKIIKDNSVKLSLNFDTNSRTWFYLPPLENDPEFIPILTIKCDFKTSIDKMNIGLILTRVDESKKFKQIGFRFEGPCQKKKSKDKKGKDETVNRNRHEYYHVQLFTKARGSKKEPLKECPQWLPTSIPCLPVKANDPISLITNLLVSLYGKGMVSKLFTGHNFNMMKSSSKPTSLLELL